jgi:hypothetical protein
MRYGGRGHPTGPVIPGIPEVAFHAECWMAIALESQDRDFQSTPYASGASGLVASGGSCVEVRKVVKKVVRR